MIHFRAVRARQHLAADETFIRLSELWHVGLAAVAPAETLAAHLPPACTRGHDILFALGKAALPMAKAAMAVRHFDSGLIIAPRGTVWPMHLPAGMRLMTGAHPVPDQSSLAAGAAALALFAQAGPDDRIIALISGGGSAMMELPLAGVTLEQMQSLTRQMLDSGAPIHAMNALRIGLSQVKGGRLAAAAGTADIHSLLMSDVPGNDLSLIASGPTLPCLAPQEPLARIAARYGLILPSPAVGSLPCNEVNAAPASSWAPAPRCIASGATMLNAISDRASALGYAVENLGDGLCGDAGSLAERHVQLALAAARAGRRTAIISGGEASVQLGESAGRGGRNLAVALHAAIGVEGNNAIAMLAADSDGIDGNSGVAGACINGNTAHQLRQRCIEPAGALARHDSFGALDAVGACFATGPTGVNVNDCRIVLIDP